MVESFIPAFCPDAGETFLKSPNLYTILFSFLFLNIKVAKQACAYGHCVLQPLFSSSFFFYRILVLQIRRILLHRFIFSLHLTLVTVKLKYTDIFLLL